MTISQIFEVVYWLWVASEIALQVATRTWNRGESRDRGSLVVLLSAIFISVSLGVTYASSHAHRMGGTWLKAAGLGMFVAGLAIRWTAIASLGHRFSVNVAIRATQTLYRGGLFRWVRHPSYSGMMLTLAGLGVETRNWKALALVMIPSTAGLLYRIHVEEQALGAAFGAEYESYSRVTKRLIPGVY